MIVHNPYVGFKVEELNVINSLDSLNSISAFLSEFKRVGEDTKIKRVISRDHFRTLGIPYSPATIRVRFVMHMTELWTNY